MHKLDTVTIKDKGLEQYEETRNPETSRIREKTLVRRKVNKGRKVGVDKEGSDKLCIGS